MDTFFAQAHGIERSLQVKGTIDDATPELACLCLGDNLQIVDRIREGLGTDLLCTVDERDARFLDAQSVADVVHIMNLLATLGLCGHGNDGCIGKEEQLFIFGNLGHRHMGEHMTRTDDAILLI